jgi:sugar transferase (PEP-CTERM system associated)
VSGVAGGIAPADAAAPQARTARREATVGRRGGASFLWPYGPRARAALAAGDIAVVTIALGASVTLHPHAAGPMDRAVRFALEGLALGGFVIYALHLYDLYRFTTIRNMQEMLVRAALAVGLATALLVLGFYFFPALDPGRPVFVSFAAFLLPLIMVWRTVADRAIRRGAAPNRVLILGATSIGGRLAEVLRDAKGVPCDLLGFVDERLPRGARFADLPVLGRPEEMAALAAELSATHVAVAQRDEDGALPLARLLALREAGLSVDDAADLYEHLTGRLLIERLTPSWVLFSGGLEKSGLERLTKRAVGIAISSVALAVLAPLLAVIAALIKLDSRGPVLFRQERVGERGRTFPLYKFRTMREDAEAATGPVWAQENDPRVTRLGRFLRKTRIDELPQLFNVLRGDMSFVGPRPERPAFVALLADRIPFYNERHRVKPGITGWAQINYRYGASVDDTERKLRYDLYYIRNLSPLIDLDIVIGTIRVMLAGSNSY